MKSFICFVLIVFLGGNLFAVGSDNPVKSSEAFITPKQFEQQAGYKLKLHERIAFRIVQKKIVKNNRKAAKADNDKKKTGLALAGALLGIAALLFLLVFPPLTLLFIPGLIVSGVALSKANKYPEEYGGKTTAIVGLVLNLVFLGLFVAYAISYGS